MRRIIPPDNRLTSQQLELLKSFRYLQNEQQIAEVKEFLNLYYRQRLEDAIDEAEQEKGFSQRIYEAWLNRRKA
jgi:hypothetical protein